MASARSAEGKPGFEKWSFVGYGLATVIDTWSIHTLSLDRDVTRIGRNDPVRGDFVDLDVGGLFDEDIVEVAEIFHGAGALLYYDGANLNAVMGISRPGDMGFDIVHFNLHKSFTQPHGGGGPGSGPIAVSDRIEPYLMVPRLVRHDVDERSSACRVRETERVAAVAP